MTWEYWLGFKKSSYKLNKTHLWARESAVTSVTSEETQEQNRVGGLWAQVRIPLNAIRTLYRGNLLLRNITDPGTAW